MQKLFLCLANVEKLVQNHDHLRFDWPSWVWKKTAQHHHLCKFNLLTAVQTNVFESFSLMSWNFIYEGGHSNTISTVKYGMSLLYDLLVVKIKKLCLIYPINISGDSYKLTKPY